MTKLDAMLKDKRVLAVDDLVEARSAMKKMLMILGATKVDMAKDGDEATAYLASNDYDIVLSDYNLGRGRDGQQILEEARFSRRLKATSIFVLLTGENAMDMVMGAIEHQPDDYITKPFTIDIMRQRLTRILSVKELLYPINNAIDRQAKDEVVQLCDDFIRSKPRLKNKVLRIKGLTLISLKRFDDALALYNFVLDDNESPWALLGKATCLFHKGQLKAAEQVLIHTLKKHPKYVQCYDLLAKIHLKNSDAPSAQKILMSATQVSPKQVLRQMELGRIALDNDDLEVAESAFRNSVKLARHSCYRNAGNYLSLAKAVQHKITTDNSREARAGSADAFKAIEEVRTVYPDNPAFVLEATMIESATFSNLGRKEEAKASADNAEAQLAEMKDPNNLQQLEMAKIYIATDQHAKAQDLLSALSESKTLSKSDRAQLERTKNGISEQVVREYTTKLNDQAISLFEKGKLDDAIELLDKATSYPEAGLAVLLNAVQVKITYMDKHNATREMVKDVAGLLERIGDIPKNDERHQRWLLLKKSQERLIRTVR